MNTSAEATLPSASRLGLVEMLVLAFLIAAVTVGAVMSAKLLQKRALASNAVNATIQFQPPPNNPTLTRPV